MALVSCGNKNAEKADSVDVAVEAVEAVVEDSIAPDSVAVDTVVATEVVEAPAQ